MGNLGFRHCGRFIARTPWRIFGMSTRSLMTISISPKTVDPGVHGHAVAQEWSTKWIAWRSSGQFSGSPIPLRATSHSNVMRRQTRP